jgi:GGDEF domain-containing protein
LAEKIGIVVAQADPLLWQGIWHAWSGDAAVGVSLLEPILDEGAQHLDTMRLTGAASRLHALRRAGLHDRLLEVAEREAGMAAESARSRSPAGIAYLGERAVAEHPELEGSGSQLGNLLRLWEQRDRERVEFAHDLLELRITHDEVESKRQELDDLARRDPLTGVLNRRGLDPLLRASARLPIGETAALLLVDVDRLKEVNDSQGHLAGDEHLQTVARALTGESRHEDVVARIGGDEFVVLAYLSPNATEQPQAIGERIRNRIADDTGGLFEFVPLPFVHMAAPIYLRGRARRGPTFEEALKMHAVARIALGRHIHNIQVSWVKMGVRGSQLALQAGANDLGGVLMNENISRAAGADHGQELTPPEMEDLIRAIGRTPRRRTTLYGVPA